MINVILWIVAIIAGIYMFNRIFRRKHFYENKGQILLYSAINCPYYNKEQKEQKFAQALSYLHKAADLGSSDACNNLGLCYYEGYGLAQDYAEALRWYQKSLSIKPSPANCSNIANIYYNGDGLTIDYNKALQYYKRAIEIYQSKWNYRATY